MNFTLHVSVQHESGKFAPREEIEGALIEALENADLDGLGADGDSVYVVEEAS
jgi:hypothetical protein